MKNISFKTICNAIEKVKLPDCELVIGVAEGGVVPAALIASKIGCDLAIMRINYRDDNNVPQHTEPVLLSSTEDIIPSSLRGTTKKPLKGKDKILLVDDEKSVRTTLQLLLQKVGYSVDAAANGNDAVSKLKSQYFDLVITDTAMPNMTGDVLAEEMMRIRPDIPIILCTGFSERTSKEKAKEMGIQGFVMKPMVMREMANTIREVLD